MQFPQSTELVYDVVELPVTDEEREKYGFNEYVDKVHWLVHYTEVVSKKEKLPMGTTPMQKVTYFNFDSDARLFKNYLDELKGVFPQY